MSTGRRDGSVQAMIRVSLLACLLTSLPPTAGAASCSAYGNEKSCNSETSCLWAAGPGFCRLDCYLLSPPECGKQTHCRWSPSNECNPLCNAVYEENDCDHLEVCKWDGFSCREGITSPAPPQIPPTPAPPAPLTAAPPKADPCRDQVGETCDALGHCLLFPQSYLCTPNCTQLAGSAACSQQGEGFCEWGASGPACTWRCEVFSAESECEQGGPLCAWVNGTCAVPDSPAPHTAGPPSGATPTPTTLAPPLPPVGRPTQAPPGLLTPAPAGVTALPQQGGGGGRSVAPDTKVPSTASPVRVVVRPGGGGWETPVPTGEEDDGWWSYWLWWVVVAGLALVMTCIYCGIVFLWWWRKNNERPTGFSGIEDASAAGFVGDSFEYTASGPGGLHVLQPLPTVPAPGPSTSIAL